MNFEQLGPYRLGKKLGQGGMGAVYEGVDTETGDAAAVKVLSPSLAADEGFRVRFEAEIESLKKLRHPNIVRLYGYGEQSGTMFYAMELVPGTSLEDELRGGRRFEWREVTSIGIKLCRALKHAHDHGVIHRDLKPANLLLTAGGEIKLSDFGIARLFGNTRMTSDGGVLGTAEYMAPEQADGRTVTDRCDQYSLGGVMYALLAGRPPFRAKTLVEMLQLQRFAEPEPITRFAPQTPAELARIVHQLLEKDPQKRFANTLMVARSLEAMERGLSIVSGREDEDPTRVVLEDDDPSSEDYSPNSPTLSATELAEARKGPGTDVPALKGTSATMAFVPSEKTSPAPGRVREVLDTGAGRFTKVDEQAPITGSARELVGVLLTPQTLTLLLALALLIGGGWYLLRAPSADQLFARIEAAAASDDPNLSRSTQADIASFLERFPDDARAEQVQAMADEARQSTPLQRAYTEAKRQVLLSPEEALARFNALIDAYDDGPDNSESTKHYLRLARVQQARLQRRVERDVEESRKVIAARLGRAADLAANDPAGAQRIYRGIVELYAQKPWASDLVRQAQTALQTSSPGTPVATP